MRAKWTGPHSGHELAGKIEHKLHRETSERWDSKEGEHLESGNSEVWWKEHGFEGQANLGLKPLPRCVS